MSQIGQTPKGRATKECPQCPESGLPFGVAAPAALAMFRHIPPRLIFGEELGGRLAALARFAARFQ